MWSTPQVLQCCAPSVKLDVAAFSSPAGHTTSGYGEMKMSLLRTVVRRAVAGAVLLTLAFAVVLMAEIYSVVEQPCNFLGRHPPTLPPIPSSDIDPGFMFEPAPFAHAPGQFTLHDTKVIDGDRSDVMTCAHAASSGC